MNISEFNSYFKSEIKEIYSPEESEQLLSLIFEHVLNFRKIDISLNKGLQLTEEVLNKLKTILFELKSNKPIQYILGYTWFSGMKIHVNNSVLIPRQETEELVDWIIKENKNSSAVILDVCTGSGCIALALKKNIPDSTVHAIDVSSEALNVVRLNSQQLSMAVKFYELDILNSDLRDLKPDIIVSNPPYVKKNEMHVIKSNVLDFEPHLALFVEDDDPLIFYKRISSLAYDALVPNGRLYFEINESLGQETMTVMKEAGFRELELRKDLNDKFRMIKGVK